MDNLLTPEETKEYIQHYIRFSGCIVSDKFTDIPYAIKDKYRELDDLLNQVARVELKKSETQAYKEKIEKLAEPEKLREAILRIFCVFVEKDNRLCNKCEYYEDGCTFTSDVENSNKVLSLLTHYINQAKQEERERIAKYMSLKDTCPHNPNDSCDVDCEKCWQEALKGDKE